MTADVCGDFRDELILAVTKEDGRKKIQVVMATHEVNRKSYRLLRPLITGSGWREIWEGGTLRFTTSR